MAVVDFIDYNPVFASEYNAKLYIVLPTDTNKHPAQLGTETVQEVLTEMARKSTGGRYLLTN